MTHEISDEEKKVLDAFKALTVQPKIETNDDLVDFIKKYGKVLDDDKGKNSSLQFTKISNFYGDVAKNEVSYQTWKYEVMSLVEAKTYSEEQIGQGIRRSCRGHAADILRRMGVSVSVANILKKFDSVYGNIDSKETVMKSLYSCQQQEGETVITFASRLEELFAKAVELKALDPTDEETLKRVFYAGLKSPIKQMAAYKFDTIADYDLFKVEIRKIENEMESSKETAPKKGSCHAIQSQGKSEIGELKDLVSKLNDRIAKLEEKEQPQQASLKPVMYNNSNGDHYNGRGRGQGPGRFQGRGRGRGYQTNRPLASNTFAPTCWQCNTVGHIARNCPN